MTLIGFSSGGIGSIEWLKRNPELVDRVITVSSPLSGNELASAATSLLGTLTPEWIRDLSIGRSPLAGLTTELAAKVTSFVGAPFDGIVTARSGRTELIRWIELSEYGVMGRFHPNVQERTPAVRDAVWGVLLSP